MAIDFLRQRLAGLDTATKCWRLKVDAGLTGDQIAAELRITKGAVSKALARAEAAALEALKLPFARHVAVQLDLLWQQYRDARECFAASKAAQARKLARTRERGQDTIRTSEVETQESVGDVKWLTEARNTLADIRALLGLDAPTKVRVYDEDRPFAEATDTDLQAELAQLLRDSGIDPTTLVAMPASKM